nr:MAG TPA: putative RNA binding protein [Caudoviricetes sp.]
MTAKEVEKLIKKNGWFLVSIEGSHHHYKHASKSGKVTIPFHKKPKDLPVKVYL